MTPRHKTTPIPRIPVNPCPANIEGTALLSHAKILDADDGRIDLALRYSHNLDDWDIGISWFHGNAREPNFTPNGTGTRLLPVYELIHQIGADVQLTQDA